MSKDATQREGPARRDRQISSRLAISRRAEPTSLAARRLYGPRRAPSVRRDRRLRADCLLLSPEATEWALGECAAATTPAPAGGAGGGLQSRPRRSTRALRTKLKNSSEMGSCGRRDNQTCVRRAAPLELRRACVIIAQIHQGEYCDPPSPTPNAHRQSRKATGDAAARRPSELPAVRRVCRRQSAH
jgi:hypothetical protein